MPSDAQDDGEIDRLRQQLEEQARDDGVMVYLAPRRSEIGVQSPDMKATGLRLWLENNGAEVVKDAGNGYLTTVPEGDDV